uniref:Proteasome subunit alpha type n=1 Tax=Paramoeba aestuarina TaxID=180227 RepID=A0A7S4KHV7_9EUKA|mmetsp:Transcript_19442/g.30468  ORF Transcript_19442/g.30468 Transcript_19442/m.30468 type:complete len:250 (+) Transcript_19442:72-821(+)|eukprot:CAMPEP_0201524806 /NCGR_PEP_ID=MMETSP0161_2-20130828/25364_1 /ASSEMBLY_ACC=CAM_ASM_000251 /TAXON_ID=180227 /ORGANISM="Neoparamoeba aestuarina, Strain SoJaBio B1-5/56/2" /LENGTH=249 /DNA_ID=CAMNT_0047924397 /DNA_START=77 /DNA_END=826 /DNA_ORIENTATION=-
MNRNLYDGDITIWSPQGRIYQVEYAMEAVKQGSTCVGARSSTHAVLATVKRSPGALAGYQKKIIEIDDHMGVAISGLTSDARVLSRYMRNECLNHKFVFDSPMVPGRLVRQVADKSQIHTQQGGRRPYGIGLLVIGYDHNGPHLYETCPSGNYFDYEAQAVGSRCQSAKTYLEKKFETFKSCSQDELVKHVLFALRESMGDKTELSEKNVSIAVVGENQKFKIIENEEVAPYIAALEGDEKEDVKMEES